MIWTLAVLLAVAVVAGIALQIAIARNGPAVLNLVDRLSGGHAHTKRLETIRFGEHPAQKIIVHRHAEEERSTPQPVIVFFHGGSWRDGDPDDYDFIGRSLVPLGFVAVTAGYRLGEDGIFPAMLHDGAAAIRWVRDNIAAHGGDPDKIILMGHSAGAYNAAMLALDPQWLEAQEVPADAVRGVVGLAGPYDFYPFDSDSTRAAFGPAPDPHATQPVRFVAGDVPPFLLIHGDEDTTVKPRNSRVLAKMLEASGVNVKLHVKPGMGHSGPLLQLASPWNRDPSVRYSVRDFAHSAKTSVSVQAKTR